ncbi:hypothetical protein E4T50_09207 [Aureobasidium sp. EXF-12298]|nr:hypothetical protein E4T50_09207 [Aureobasidium sp. EXF-12298]
MSLLDILASGPTAHIIVGSRTNTKSFHIHKKVLCDSSTYFKAALHNGFAETKTQTIKLDDEDPEIFSAFAIWLYEGKLNKTALPHVNVRGAIEKHLFKLYVFADKRGIRDLANDTITMLASYWTQDSVSLGEVEWVIPLVSHNSDLYHLIQDTLILELRLSSLDYNGLAALDLPRKFLTDLLCKSHELSEAFNDYEKCLQAVCHYHCHEGQGLRSKEECIRNTEDGYNTYGEHKDLVQMSWEGDA